MVTVHRGWARHLAGIDYVKLRDLVKLAANE